MKKKIKLLGSLVVIAAVILIAVRFLAGSEKAPIDVSYPEFIRFIGNEMVAQIEYDGVNETAEALLTDGSKVKTEVLNEDIFLEYIQKQIVDGNTLEIENAPESINPFDVILTLLLSFYMGGALIYGFKFLKGSMNLKRNSRVKKDPPSFQNFAGMFNTDINYMEKMTKSDVKFSDVAGLDEEKAELEEIVDFMKNPEKYWKLGAKIPKGALLSGSPGTGKTLLAKAVAGEAGVAYIAVSGSEFVEKYVGVGAQRIRGLFKEARKQAPCIIFIDEIDAIGSARSDSNDERNQTLEQLLTELDGFADRTDIVIMAATNRPESLDPALVRPGRFDRKITVNLPDIKGREEILKVHARNKKFLDDVDFHVVACNTAGYSGAELENLLNESALVAARHKHKVIQSADIFEAQKKLIVGLRKSGRVISDEERKLTAYHEAGHAIVSYLLPTQAPIKEISIVPRGGAGGYTWYERIEDRQYIGKNEFQENIIGLLAGRAAEKYFLGEISTGASNDIEVATKYAKQMIMVYGMDDDLGPVSYNSKDVEDYLGDEMLGKIWNKIRLVIKEAEEKATILIKTNNTTIKALAELLLEYETISGETMEKLLNGFDTDDYDYVISADNAE